jgi:hypothetical protein
VEVEVKFRNTCHSLAYNIVLFCVGVKLGSILRERQGLRVACVHRIMYLLFVLHYLHFMYIMCEINSFVCFS